MVFIFFLLCFLLLNGLELVVDVLIVQLEVNVQLFTFGDELRNNIFVNFFIAIFVRLCNYDVLVRVLEGSSDKFIALIPVVSGLLFIDIFFGLLILLHLIMELDTSLMQLFQGLQFFGSFFVFESAEVLIQLSDILTLSNVLCNIDIRSRADFSESTYYRVRPCCVCCDSFVLAANQKHVHLTFLLSTHCLRHLP